MTKAATEQIRLWAKKISESDQEAFDSLFRSLYPRLVRFAFRYTQNKAVASDIVQDIFVKLWEKRQEIDCQGFPKAYMYRSVRNRALNYLRDHSAETVGLELLNDSLLKSTDKIDRADEQDQLVGLLKTWIEHLPNRQREAFKLSRFEGLDHDEIAGVMEVSPSTVNNHIVAALDTLRNRYDTYQKKQINNK